MASEEEVKVVSEATASVQFGKGPAYRQGRKMSIKAALGCAAAGIAALVPVFLLSPPENPSEDVKERIKTPDSMNLHPGQPTVSLDAYSAREEKAKEDARRKEKRSHAAVVRLKGLESIVRPGASRIPPGSLVKAALVSGASNGPVRAELKEALLGSGGAIFPAGTVLLGRGQSSENRLYIHFSQAVFEKHEPEAIDATAIDGEDKIAGLRGSKIGHYAAKLGAAIGLNFVGGMAEGLEEKESMGQQVVRRTNTKNALLSGASHASLDLANETMADLKNKPPVIEVESGREILVLFGAAE